jgi:hypothetical protein
MDAKHARVCEVAAALEGSCQDLSAVATEAEREDTEFLLALDEQVFCCDCCGWWCNADERGEEGDTCTDCEEDAC